MERTWTTFGPGKGNETEATATLNRICYELGVCDSGAILRTPQIKHAGKEE